jgi:hypothetical protein
MKKRMFSMTLSAVLALVMLVGMIPNVAYAAGSNDYSVRINSVQPEWLDSTEMVDWSTTDRWANSWIDWLINTGVRNPTWAQRVEVAYKAATDHAHYNTALLDSWVTHNGQRVQVRNLPNDALAQHVPQYTFSEMLAQVAAFAGGDGTRPLWTCGDFSRFMVGLLRYQGIPAYIEIGNTNRELHARVAVIDSSRNLIFYSDPSFGASSRDIAKWRWLTRAEYDESGYRQSHISSERLPSRPPSGGNNQGPGGTPPPPVNPNPQPPITRPEYQQPVRINIPAANRWGGSEVIVPIRQNGTLIGNIPMRVLWYDNSYWFTARDACAVLAQTTRSVWVRYDDRLGTIVFNRGDYEFDRDDTNWGYGRNSSGQRVWTGRFVGIDIDKNAQAWQIPNAWFGNEQTNIRVINIGGTVYVRPVDIARLMNFDGSVAYENELGASFRFR